MATLISIVKALMGLLLAPPRYPVIRIPGMAQVIYGWLEFFYWRGCLDGFILGTLMTMLLMPRIRRHAEGKGYNALQDY